MQAVETVVLDVLRTSANRPPNATILEYRRQLSQPGATVEPYYDAAFVAAHSLGSTIALDALMNVHELAKEQGLDTNLWRRLRGLITFGTSLEKTKFFIDVRNPSFSASVQHWRDDVYGHLFTADPDVLRKPNDGSTNVGIHWSNFWYFNDLVANEIASYCSNVSPGGNALLMLGAGKRPVCKNVLLKSSFPSRIWVHGDYLGDDHFWDSDTDAQTIAYRGVTELIA